MIHRDSKGRFVSREELVKEIKRDVRLLQQNADLFPGSSLIRRILSRKFGAVIRRKRIRYGIYDCF